MTLFQSSLSSLQLAGPFIARKTWRSFLSAQCFSSIGQITKQEIRSVERVSAHCCCIQYTLSKYLTVTVLTLNFMVYASSVSPVLYEWPEVSWGRTWGGRGSNPSAWLGHRSVSMNGRWLFMMRRAQSSAILSCVVRHLHQQQVTSIVNVTAW